MTSPIGTPTHRFRFLYNPSSDVFSFCTILQVMSSLLLGVCMLFSYTSSPIQTPPLLNFLSNIRTVSKTFQRVFDFSFFSNSRQNEASQIFMLVNRQRYSFIDNLQVTVRVFPEMRIRVQRSSTHPLELVLSPDSNARCATWDSRSLSHLHASGRTNRRAHRQHGHHADRTRARPCSRCHKREGLQGDTCAEECRHGVD